MNTTMTFWYRNYRGEVSQRNVVPCRIYFGGTDWHPEPQWLMEAWDIEKSAMRAFAMADMNVPAEERTA